VHCAPSLRVVSCSALVTQGGCLPRPLKGLHRTTTLMFPPPDAMVGVVTLFVVGIRGMRTKEMATGRSVYAAVRGGIRETSWAATAVDGRGRGRGRGHPRLRRRCYGEVVLLIDHAGARLGTRSWCPDPCSRPRSLDWPVVTCAADPDAVQDTDTARSRDGYKLITTDYVFYVSRVAPARSGRYLTCAMLGSS